MKIESMVIKKLVIYQTRAYFTAATIMDRELGMLVMFSLFILFVIPRVLEFLKKVIKPQRTRLLTPLRFVVYYRRRLYELSEYLLTILTLVCPDGQPDAVRSVLRCHQVSYSYITLSIRAKANSRVANHAIYRVSGNKGKETKQHNYPVSTSYESHGEKHTLVDDALRAPLRTDATLGKGVSEGTMKKNHLLQNQRRYYSSNRGSQYDEFFGNHIRSLIKHVKAGVWPKGELASAIEKGLASLQAKICKLSSVNRKDEAMILIEKYMLNIANRFMAINKIRRQSVHSTDEKVLKTDQSCLDMLNHSKWVNRKKWPQSEVRYVDIPKPDGTYRGLGIVSTLDRVLQLAFHYVMDPYYEAKYPSDMYSFRKGRGSIQALGLLQHILEQADTKSLGILMIEIRECFDNIDHEYILHTLHYPESIKPMALALILRWLKPLIKDRHGKVTRQERGIAQGSIIGPLICNVVLMNLLHGSNRPAQPEIFSSLPQTKSVMVDGVQRVGVAHPPVCCGSRSVEASSTISVHRHIIYYADDIVITTTNSTELITLKSIASRRLRDAGLELSEQNTKMFDFNNLLGKLSFDYMGFKLMYVPKSKIRCGGIIRRKADITSRKNVSDSPGTFLVYTSDKRFEAIKEKCKAVINKLLHSDVLSVINEINPIIRSHAQYFAWSNSYSRLKTLEGLLFRAFKKYLIRKFRNRGLRRPRWVAKNFLFCKKGLSPYNLSWHVHVKLHPTTNNVKRFKNYLFLVLPTKTVDILPVKNGALKQNIRNVPYYLDPYLYIQHNSNIFQERINKGQ